MDFESALTAIDRATSVDDLSAILLDWRDESGVAHLVYHVAHVSACQTPNPLLLLTYDDAWVKRYVERALFTITANSTDADWRRWRRTDLRDVQGRPPRPHPVSRS
jgi:hypothetical protein